MRPFNGVQGPQWRLVIASLVAGCGLVVAVGGCTVPDPVPSVTPPSPASSVPPTSSSPPSVTAPPVTPTAPPPPVERADGCSGPLTAATRCLTTDGADPLPDGLLTDAYEVRTNDELPAWAASPVLETLQPDGRLAGTRRPFTSTSDCTLPLEVGWWNRGLFSPVWTNAHEPCRAVYGVATDGRALAWAEGIPQGLGVSDWWIRAFGPSSISTIAAWATMGYGQGASFVGMPMAMADGMVYWTAGVPEGPGGGGRDTLLSAGLGGTDPIQTVASGTGAAATDGLGTLYYAVAVGGGYDVMRTGVESPVMPAAVPADTYAMAGLAADGDHVAWYITQRDDSEASFDKAYYSWVYVLDRRDGSLTEIATHSSGGGGNVLSVSGGWIAWGTGSGWGGTQQYLVNLSTGTSYVVADTPGASWIRVNYPAVVWYEAYAPGTAPDVQIPLVRTMVGFLP